MRKKVVAILLATAMALSMSACGGSGTSSKSSSDAGSTTKAETTTEPEEETSYQSILDDYTKEITDATPGLVNEYNTESAEKAGDINALAELSNAKITKLAEICNEGVSKMAEIQLKTGDDYSTYEEWAAKLQDVYTQQSQQITDAYMASAQ
ncbi:MAG: hypothetical protein PHW34_15165 [Hespellia sp.]|nr:hypothetical protein [Hespellia sp.]